MLSYEFYEKLVESTEIPKTSQITPVRFIEKYQEMVSKGDQIIVRVKNTETAMRIYFLLIVICLPPILRSYQPFFAQLRRFYALLWYGLLIPTYIEEVNGFL